MDWRFPIIVSKGIHGNLSYLALQSPYIWCGLQTSSDNIALRGFGVGFLAWRTGGILKARLRTSLLTALELRFCGMGPMIPFQGVKYCRVSNEESQQATFPHEQTSICITFWLMLYRGRVSSIDMLIVMLICTNENALRIGLSWP